MKRVSKKIILFGTLLGIGVNLTTYLHKLLLLRTTVNVNNDLYSDVPVVMNLSRLSKSMERITFHQSTTASLKDLERREIHDHHHRQTTKPLNVLVQMIGDRIPLVEWDPFWNKLAR